MQTRSCNYKRNWYTTGHPRDFTGICTLEEEMGVLLIVALVATIVYVICRIQARGASDQIRQARGRMLSGRHSSGDQNTLDVTHVPVWEAKLGTLNLIRRLSVYVGLGSLGVYVTLWAISWARFYGWIG